MRHAIVLITSLVALLAFTPGTLAQDAGTGTPAALLAATPAPVAQAFEFGPEAGANPGVMEQGFFVYELAPGDEAAGSVYLLSTGTEPITVELGAVDSETAQNGGSSFADAAATPVAVGSWVQVDEPRVTLEPGEETSVGFTVQAPADAAPGQYMAGIVAYIPAVTEAAAGEASQAGASVITQVRYIIGVEVDVPGAWTPAMTITGAEAMELPSGTQLGIAMENTGDTFIKPEGKVTLTNADLTPILEQPITLGTFLTGSDLTYPVAWPGVPAGGEYGVDVELNYGDNQVANYRGMLTVSDNAPVASVPGAETQPVVAPVPAPVPAPSAIQPWMIMTVIGLAVLLVVLVVVLLVMVLRNRRNSSAW